MKTTPTTFEMDGLFTEEDINNRFTVMRQCRGCNKWTKMHIEESIPCIECGNSDYDLHSTKSLRTYNPEIDNKRRPKNPPKKKK